MTNQPNRPSLDDAQTMTPDQIADLPLAQIAALQDDLAELKAKTKQVDDLLTAALEDRFGTRARKQQQTGTVRLDDEDGLTVKVDIPKRVDWDQDTLASVARTIRDAWGDDPTDYLRVKYEVSEAAYKHWPRDLQAVVEPARTVKAGKPKFTIEQKETV